MDDKQTIRIEPAEIEAKLKHLTSENACLIVIHGPNLGQKINLDRDTMRIGRAEQVEIRINEENVSRHHAVITRQQDAFIIEDHNSTNGTFINTQKTQRAVLRDQDLIMIGDTIFKFLTRENLERAYHEELHRQATMDTLLQIYNKSFFLDRLQAELSRCRRHHRDVSLIMFDVDYFKRVNDTYGHQAGDYVLKRIANIVLHHLRTEDIFGRYGGEEFVIMLPETDAEQACGVAEKLRTIIALTKFSYQNQEIAVTISLGVAAYNPFTKEPRSYHAFIERADQAMYVAKKDGRNKVVCYDNIR